MATTFKKLNTPFKNRLDYWKSKARAGDPLSSRIKACDDCAVVWGLYSELSDELAKQNLSLQTACAKRWHCHADWDKTCKGNWDNLANKWRENDRTKSKK